MQPMEPVPHAGYVVAKEKKEQDVHNAGFERAQTTDSERNASLGEVVAIGGPVKDHTTPDLQPGQIFAYAPFSAVKLRIGVESWLFIEFKDVLAGF